MLTHVCTSAINVLKNESRLLGILEHIDDIVGYHSSLTDDKLREARDSMAKYGPVAVAKIVSWGKKRPSATSVAKFADSLNVSVVKTLKTGADRDLSKLEILRVVGEEAEKREKRKESKRIAYVNNLASVYAAALSKVAGKQLVRDIKATKTTKDGVSMTRNIDRSEKARDASILEELNGGLKGVEASFDKALDMYINSVRIRREKEIAKATKVFNEFVAKTFPAVDGKEIRREVLQKIKTLPHHLLADLSRSGYVSIADKFTLPKGVGVHDAIERMRLLRQPQEEVRDVSAKLQKFFEQNY